MRGIQSTFIWGWKLLLAWFENGNQGFLDVWDQAHPPQSPSAPSYDRTVAWYALSLMLILSGLIIWASQLPTLLEHYKIREARKTSAQTFSFSQKSSHQAYSSLIEIKQFEVYRQVNAGRPFFAHPSDPLTEAKKWQTLMDRPPHPMNLKRVKDRIFNQEFLGGFKGKVSVRIAVDALGLYRTHYITQSSSKALEQAVEAHLQHLVFRPAIRNGRTIAGWTVVSFTF